AKIPATLADDEALVQVISERYGTHRWMFIPNTLHLDTLYVSPDLAVELSRHARCRVEPNPVTLQFQDGQIQLPF
ncbi:MAG: hypothetical protein WCK86_18420, partial [Planctomycetia bacterium]